MEKGTSELTQNTEFISGGLRLYRKHGIGFRIGHFHLEIRTKELDSIRDYCRPRPSQWHVTVATIGYYTPNI